MGHLVGLEGLSVTEIECEFIQKPSDIRKIIKSGKAATAADDKGAINVWRDDAGMIRCNAMAWLRSIEKRQFKTFPGAEKWVSKWLKKIR
jgi:hypothetical protein